MNHQLKRGWMGRLLYGIYRLIDAVFRPMDQFYTQVTEHLRLLPPARYRTGGQTALSEYAHTCGVIAAQIGAHLRVDNPSVLDLGCGTGKMVSACWTFLGKQGHYTGIDVNPEVIQFARDWYPSERCTFHHASLFNAHYNPHGTPFQDYRLPLADTSVDLVLALSLFTHLNQPDTEHYFGELARVMKPDSVALPTFFIIEPDYDPSHYQGTRWSFDRIIDGQPEWRWTSWFNVPERQIGVTRAGLERLLGHDFVLEHIYRGTWSGKAGAFIQDTVVLRRK